MKVFSKTTLLLISLFLHLTSYGTHLQGGEIVWKCKNNGTYQFTLVLYRECGSSVTIPTTAQTLTNNAGVAISCSYISTTDVTPSCYSGTEPCVAGANLSGLGRMQKYIFRSGDIILTGTPPTSGWTFSWNSCCRPQSVANVANAGGVYYWLRATMYPYTPPGSTSPLSAGSNNNPTCYDSSPDFLEDPQLVACAGQDIVYNNYGFDLDIDSLYYVWANPLGASGAAVPWSTGFSTSNQLPSNSGSTAATLFGEVGTISFNSNQAGNFATCIGVEAWRCNQKIAEVFRDIPIVLRSCSSVTGLCSSSYNPVPPDVFFQSDSSLQTPTSYSTITNSIGDTIEYYTQGFPGDTIAFKISAADAFVNPNCTQQEIDLLARGGNLSSASNYGNVNMCLFNPPCATLTSLNSNLSFSSYGYNNVLFRWVLDTAHLAYNQTYCQSSIGTDYEFFFKFKDDQCPVPLSSYLKLRVKVLGSNIVAPLKPNLKCGSYVGSNQLKLEWTPNQDTGMTWDHYIIGRETAGGTLLSSNVISNWSDSSYIINNALPSQNHKYFIQTKGGLGYTSQKYYFSLDKITDWSTVSCYPVTVNGITYDSSGTYHQNFFTSKGCDSIYRINVTINASNFTLHPENDTVGPGQTAVFTVNASSGVSYQWQSDVGLGFNNILDGGQFQGAQSPMLFVSSAQPLNHLSKYRCVKMGGSCNDTSLVATLYLSTIGLEEQSLDVSLYPNPADHSFRIVAEFKAKGVRVFNLISQEVYRDESSADSYLVNTQNWPQGRYTVLVSHENGMVPLEIMVQH